MRGLWGEILDEFYGGGYNRKNKINFTGGWSR